MQLLPQRLEVQWGDRYQNPAKVHENSGSWPLDSCPGACDRDVSTDPAFREFLSRARVGAFTNEDLGPDSFLKWSSHCIRQMEPPLESGFHFKKNGPFIWLNGPFIGLEMVGPFERPHQKITPTATSPNPAFPYLFTRCNCRKLQ